MYETWNKMWIGNVLVAIQFKFPEEMTLADHKHSKRKTWSSMLGNAVHL